MAPPLSTKREDQDGGLPVIMSSLNDVEISTPEPKLDQLTSTRPVSGSTSMNSLSAVPLARVGEATSKGPCQGWPASAARRMESGWIVPLKLGGFPVPFTMSEE